MARVNARLHQGIAQIDPNIIWGDQLGDFQPDQVTPQTPEPGAYPEDFSTEQLDIRETRQLSPEQKKLYYALGIGRALTEQSLAQIMEPLLDTGLPITRMEKPGIVYVEVEPLARQANFGRNTKAPHPGIILRKSPVEFVAHQVADLREGHTLDKSSKYFVGAQVKEVVPRISAKNRHVSWLTLNVTEPKARDYPDEDQVLEEMLAVAAVLDPEKHLVLKNQAIKRAKRRKPFVHSIPLGSVNHIDLRKVATAAEMSPEGYLRQVIQKNQPTTRRVDLSQVTSISSAQGTI